MNSNGTVGYLGAFNETIINSQGREQEVSRDAVYRQGVNGGPILVAREGCDDSPSPKASCRSRRRSV
jgi:hypothetical protein